MHPIFATAGRRMLAALALMLAYAAAFAAGMPGEVPGGADHPMIKRFTGSTLVGFKRSDWDQTVLPLSARDNVDGKTQLQDKRVVEGKLTRLVYLAPLGKTPLEVHRNYEAALQAAGLKKLYACDGDCSKLYFAWTKTTDIDAGMTWSKGTIASTRGGAYNVESPLNFDGRMLVGSLAQGGREVFVLLYTSSASDESTRLAATYLEIIEPKAMATGQVTVDAKAMQGGLQADGKIALYGIFFDTGKAELKPESKAQLDEMAKLLQGQPTLRVYIVGHTDNQGSLDANVALSQQRAQAVVAALGGTYKVDAKRLQARGVASLAPVATNTTDEGRARNRRVELVVQ
jgi:outer membrane protein OmpA-like peptidoglycan-associated protein